MSNWQFLLDDSTNTLLTDLEGFALARSVKKTRNAPQTVGFSLDLMDDGSKALLNALDHIPRVRVYQNEVLRFHTVFSSLREAASDVVMMECTFTGPLSRVLGDGSSTGRYTGANVTFATTDAGQIAKALLDTANSESETGIDTSGSIAATTNRDVIYNYKNIGQAIIDLAQLSPGFDFEEIAQEAVAGKITKFYVYAHQGSVKPNAVFQYGPETMDNVLEITRTTQPPTNSITVTGSDDQIGTASDVLSISDYGKYAQVVSAMDISDQTMLNARASDQLRPKMIKVIGFTPDPATAPVPFVDYDVGDTVSLFADKGNFKVDTTVRINSIEVKIDNNGVETDHMITVEEV